MIPFEIRYLECHVLVSNNIVTFFFFAVILGCFAWEDRSKVEFFSFLVNLHVMRLSSVTWTFPKINGILSVFDSTTHPYQIQLIAIVQDLRAFFNKKIFC